jgi:hypothetical protein
MLKNSRDASHTREGSYRRDANSRDANTYKNSRSRIDINNNRTRATSERMLKKDASHSWDANNRRDNDNGGNTTNRREVTSGPQ